MNKKQTPTSLDFEITNVEQMNDNISECDVRVFYHGKNRNGSYISKAVGEQIATTLPRAPIVAFYKEEVEDFGDHGEEVTINSDGVHFKKKTMPYGAIDQDTPLGNYCRREWCGKRVYDSQGLFVDRKVSLFKKCVGKQ